MIKDRDLRLVVRLLAQRVNYLHDEIKLIKEKHPDGCKRRLRTNPRADPFLRGFSSKELNELLGDE